MNIVMIGTGYVGLTTGLGFASLGHSVACVDINEQIVAKLDRGEATIFEEGVPEMLKKMQEEGRVVFTTDLSSVMNEADVVMIAVQTPPLPNGAADLTYVYSAVDQIAVCLKKEIILVIKSTVPVGSNRKILEHLQKTLKELGKDDLSTLVQIASVPEFLAQGTALRNFLEADRIVIGADDDLVFDTLDKMHEGINAPVVRTTIESAELIKSASNAFLATKISFINELANVCNLTNADVREVAKGMGLDPRIGKKFLRAGVGYGGSCFPKDTSALESLAGVVGYDFQILRSVIRVNQQVRLDFFKKINTRLGELKGRRIGVWGIAFKPGTDDVRDSAAIDIVRFLIAHGADVTIYDPEASENAKRMLPEGVTFASTPIDAADAADALVLLTEWPEFLQVSFPTLKSRMINPLIFDGRNLLANSGLKGLGFEYHGVGVCDSNCS